MKIYLDAESHLVSGVTTANQARLCQKLDSIYFLNKIRL